MTIIAGLKGNGCTWLASDSAGSNCSHIEDYGSKIVTRDGWAFAYTYSYRSAQIIEALTEGRKIETRADVLKLAEDIYDRLKERGAGSAESNELPTNQLTIIVATPHKLFTIGSGFAVYEHRRYTASGSGGQYACGVIESLLGVVDKEKIMRQAVKVACKLNPHCGGRTFLVKISKDGDGE